MASFDTERGESVIITGDNNNTIVAKNGEQCIGFGSKWISPDHIETAQYMIKLIKIKHCGIAITTTDDSGKKGDNDDDSLYMVLSEGSTMVMSGNNEKEGKLDVTFASGDILKYTLNFATKQVLLAINNNPQSVLFENIAVKKSYKLWLMLGDEGDTVMIMDYKEVKQWDEERKQEQKQMESMQSELEQYKNQNNELTSQIVKVTEENEALKAKNNHLMQENQSLKDKLEIMQHEKKEMELELKNAKIKSINTDNWSEWTTNDVLLWILSIEDNRFGKYEEKLNTALQEQEIIGEILADVNENDILGWGVKSFKDKKLLLKYIKQLIQSQNINDEGNNVAPTAFI